MKKVFTLMLALVMVLSLAACGKTAPTEPAGSQERQEQKSSKGSLFGRSHERVTADMLMERLSSLGDKGYMDMRMLIEADATDDDGNSFSMAMSGDVEYAGDVVHISDMTLDYAMEGLSMDFSIDAWSDDSSGESYIKMKLLGQDTGWMASDSSDSDSSEMADGAAGMAEGVSKLYDDAELQLMPHESDSDDWVVRWTLSLDELSDAMDMKDIVTGDIGHGSVDCEARFASDLSPKSVEAVSASGTNVRVLFEFKEIGGKKTLSIPADVIAEAAANGNGNLFGGSSGLGGSVDIADTGNSGSSGRSNVGGDGFIDGMAALIRAVDSDEDAVDTYDFGDYQVLNYRTGKSGEWYADIEIRYVVNDDYMSARDFFESHKESTASWFDGAAPVKTAANGSFVIYSDYAVGEDYWDMSLLTWNGDVELRADCYEYGGASYDEALTRLYGILNDIGCNQWMPSLMKNAA